MTVIRGQTYLRISNLLEIDSMLSIQWKMYEAVIKIYAK